MESFYNLARVAQGLKHTLFAHEKELLSASEETLVPKRLK